jgi:hypothetical protein
VKGENGVKKRKYMDWFNSRRLSDIQIGIVGMVRYHPMYDRNLSNRYYAFRIFSLLSVYAKKLEYKRNSHMRILMENTFMCRHFPGTWIRKDGYSVCCDKE